MAKPTYEELEKKIQDLELSLKESKGKASQDSEVKLSCIINSMDDLVFILDKENRFVSVFAPENQLYLKPGKFLGKKNSDIMPKHIDDLLTTALVNINKGEIAEFEYQLEMRDGSQWYHAKVSRLIGYKKQKEIVAIVRNITPRKRVEIDLQNRENKIKSILQAAPIGIGVVSNRIIIEVNQKFCEISGYSREELLGQNARMVYASDEAYEYVGKEKYRMINEKGTGSVETIFRRKDGEIINVLVSSTRIDPTDLSAGVTFTALDITERRKVEADLRQSERKFRLLADHTYDWEYWIDLDGNYVYLSPSCERITGYSPEEFISDPKLFYKIVKPNYTEKVHRHYTDKNNPELPIHSMEFPILAKNGQEVWIEHNCTPVYDKQENYLGRRGNNRDITDQKKAQTALIRSEKKWRNILINTPQIGISIDPKAKITFANKHFLILTGWEEHEIMGQDWFDFFIPENIRKEVRKVFSNVMAQKEATGFSNNENKIKTKTGELRNVSWANVLTKDTKGIITDVTSLGIDLTEKKELEARLNQAQKMESIGRLAGGVAHDFNNALSVIMGFAEMALDDTDPKEPLHENLNEILTAALRAADTTRQLLAFARKQTISPTVLHFNETIEGMFKMLRRLIGEDIDLAWLPGSNLWPVKMDPSQIDQILANLCLNARDAIEGVGKITIESENVIFNKKYCTDHPEFVPGEFVQLSVSDSGCGMDKATLENIFEPFFTTKEVGKGTGLGLATVYGITKQNNGFINAYSELGQGTDIKIYLPRHKAKPVEICEKNTEQIPSGQGETILVVEDDTSIIKIMEKLLTGLDYKVLTSSHPEKVMDKVKAHTGRIHLLLTDVIMPKMNGRDLAEQLQPICPDLKCIFMSGYTADVITHKGVLDKKENFIQKPFSRKDLAEMVRKVLDKK